MIANQVTSKTQNTNIVLPVNRIQYNWVGESVEEPGTIDENLRDYVAVST